MTEEEHSENIEVYWFDFLKDALVIINKLNVTRRKFTMEDLRDIWIGFRVEAFRHPSQRPLTTLLNCLGRYKNKKVNMKTYRQVWYSSFTPTTSYEKLKKVVNCILRSIE